VVLADGGACMAVVLLTGDLTVISRVEGAAKQIGSQVRAFASASQVFDSGIVERAGLLIVDLSTPSLEVKTFIEQLREATRSRPRVVAFGPHVHEERLEAARQAGCDEVVSRGEFFVRIGSILAGS